MWVNILTLFLVVHAGLAFTLLDNNDEINQELLQWPSEYNLKGEELDLKTGIKETFEIWYSEAANKSRIDYYGGIDKKFYFGETENNSAVAYMVIPITDEDLSQHITCSEISFEGRVKTHLPTIKDLLYKGEKELMNKKVQIWEWSKDIDGEKYEVTILAYVTDQGHVPLQLSIIKYNIEQGSIEDHSVTQYYNYKNNFDWEIFELEEEYDCEAGASLNSELKFLRSSRFTDLEFAFSRYENHHDKVYSEDEYEIRKAIFHKNWKLVEEHNKKNLGYKLELNAFADRTEKELSYLSGTRPSKNSGDVKMYNMDLSTDNLPEEYDMRFEGYITPIKNQASCGSCWAFSTTAAVEGAIARRDGGRDLDLSEQSLVDCAWGYGNAGCNGGDLDGAMKYVLQYGIPPENEYGPYLKQDGYCNIFNMTKVYNLQGFGRVTPGNSEAMKAVLYNYGPVVVALHAGAKMKLYSSGVFYDFECDDSSQNHGVTIVGYGTREGDLYWIAKNSWGEDWGEGGYILLSATNNNCFVLNDAYYPIV